MRPRAGDIVKLRYDREPTRWQVVWMERISSTGYTVPDAEWWLHLQQADYDDVCIRVTLPETMVEVVHPVRRPSI